MKKSLCVLLALFLAVPFTCYAQNTLSKSIETEKKPSINSPVNKKKMPEIKWHRVLINKKNGFPLLKFSLKDDEGLKNICFVREFVDDFGYTIVDMYDILSLANKKEKVCYRTLQKEGAYHVQINDIDEEIHRLDTEVLITLLDTDGDGVVDCYYTTDENKTTLLDVDEEALPALDKNICLD